MELDNDLKKKGSTEKYAIQIETELAPGKRTTYWLNHKHNSHPPGGKTNFQTTHPSFAEPGH